ncbi:MAG: SpoIIE family protein phosphatase [Actinomycetota bacterium]|nr:SpoIIE family protein phosphatase [Actinomycetota bacterium]
MVQEITGSSSAEQERRVLDLEQTLESLREDSEIAHVLLGLAGLLAEVRSVEETLETAVRVVPELLGADRCFAATRLGMGRQFSIMAHAGFEPEEVERLREATAGPESLPLLSAALVERTPLMIPDASVDERVSAEQREQPGLGAYVGIPLVRWGEEFGGLGLEYSEPREFKPKDLALARGIARQVGVALVNARRFNLLAGLRAFGLRVASKLRLSEVIEEISHGAAELLAGDAASIYFFDSDRRTLVAPPGVAGAANGELLRVDLNEAPWSGLGQERAIVVPDLRLGGEDSDPWTIVAAPVPGEGEGVVGAVLVFFRRAVTLAPDEAEALSVLAGQAAMSVENAKRYERQRRVARSLQEGLLLTDLPTLEGCDLAAVYDPASGQADIGGDFYDVFDLPGGRYAIVVGDVSGKGAESAALTAMAKYMLRAFAIRNPAPPSVLFHLNNALVHDFEAEKFVTLMYGLLDPTQQRCSFGLAGHPPPLIYRSATETVETIELQGSILGVFEDEQYQQETFTFDEDDVMMAFTDGLLEARSGKEFYGRRRIEQQLLKRAPGASAAELTQRLLEDAKEFGSISDDTVVFALKFLDQHRA